MNVVEPRRLPDIPPLQRDACLVAIYAGGPYLRGEMILPDAPIGAVVLIQQCAGHGISEECRTLAQGMAARRTATLAVNLAREDGAEEAGSEVERTRCRVAAIVDWLRAEPTAGCLPQGLYAHEGVCGGAACLMVAAERPGEIDAVALRCGRPDRAGHALGMCLPPTLLIVGEGDVAALRPTKDAFRRLRTRDKALELIPGASGGFREAGVAEKTAALAIDWFSRHFPTSRRLAA